jgi:hypothetical protein
MYKPKRWSALAYSSIERESHILQQGRGFEVVHGGGVWVGYSFLAPIAGLYNIWVLALTPTELSLPWRVYDPFDHTLRLNFKLEV